MKLNVVEFQNVLRKSTFNFSIETANLNITEGRIASSMINKYNTGITIIDIENKAITEMEDVKEMVFNFMDPDQNLMPFLNLIDVPEVRLKVFEDKIAIFVGRQKQTIHFCTPQKKRMFHSEATLRSQEYFANMDLADGSFFEMWSKIKKVGTRFGKVYFNVEKENLTVESTDKTNKFSNSIKFILSKLEGVSDLSLCFEFTDIANLMKIIGMDFSFGFSYSDDHGLGLLHASKEDGSENFFLMSKKE
jgi:hypothetical protein